MRISKAVPAVLAVAAVSLMTACGSSANFSTTAGTTGAEDQYGNPVTSSGTTTPTDSAAGSESTGLTPSASAATTGPADAFTNPGPGPGDAGGAVTTPGGPAITTPIRVTYLVQDAAGASALTGSSNPNSTAGTEQTFKALVAYANAHGGVGGRKIIATAIVEQATSMENTRLADCKKATEDQKAQVFIDMNQMLQDDVWSCFAQHHTAFFGTASGADRTYLNSVAPYINTTYISLDRQMRSVVSAANSVGFYTKQKVGVLMSDDPGMHRAYENVLKPELAKIGITPYVRYIGGASASDQQAATSNAELAFASNGVTRIIFFHNILVYLGFTQQANAQRYYPEYVYTDYQGMASVAAFYGKSNKENVGALAVSQQATVDKPEKTDVSAPLDRSQVSPGQRKCLDLLTKQTGKDYYDPQKSGDAQASWEFYCDEFLLWWESANKIGNAWSVAQTLLGLRREGASFLSPLQHSVDFSGGFSDGGSSVRVGKWNTGCGCWPAITGWIKLPA